MLSMSIYMFVSKEFDIDIENIRVRLRVLQCNFKSAPLWKHTTTINHTCSPFWHTSLHQLNRWFLLFHLKKKATQFKLWKGSVVWLLLKIGCSLSTNIDDHFHGNFPMYLLFHYSLSICLDAWLWCIQHSRRELYASR